MVTNLEDSFLSSLEIRNSTPLRSERIEAAVRRLETGLEEMICSGKWAEYLQFSCQFHHYSFGNQLLIWLQKPTATRVASYLTWKKVGRQVRRGEKGLEIFVPIFVKKSRAGAGFPAPESDNGIEGQEGESLLALSDEPAVDLCGFKIGHVFDLTQTDGDPLPDQRMVLQGDDAGLIKVMDAFACDRLGLQIQERSDLGVFGLGTTGICLYDPISEKASHILILEALPLLQKASVCAHEIAHALLHTSREYRNHTPRSIMELEAESVAFVLLNYFQAACSQFTFAYLAGWGGGESAIREIRKSGERIHQAAEEVISWIEERGLLRVVSGGIVQDTQRAVCG